MSNSQISGYAPLPDSFRGGLTAIVVCCFLSCIASFALLCFLSYETIEAKFSRGRGRSVIRNNIPQGYFWLVQLFIADFIESFTTLFITGFLTSNSLITGPYCTFQAVGLISGVIGSAIWTLVITVNTFLLLIGGRNMRAWVIEKSSSGWERWVLSIAIWIFVLLSGLFGFIKPVETDKGPYYDQLGTGWCYIGQNYRWESIFFTYAFLFLDMVTLTIFYGILFFFIRAQTKGLRTPTTTDQQTTHDLGTTANGTQWEVSLGTSDDIESSPAHSSGPVIVTKSVSISTEANPRTHRPQVTAQRTYRRINKVSVTLLIYPLLYLILTMPICIARIAAFAGQDLGLPFTYSGAALFESTGFVNVLLYTSTRKGLVSWNRLAFWKKDVNESSGRTGRQTGGEAGEIVNLESLQRVRLSSKASSVAPLKDEINTRGEESDEDSHLES